MALSEEQLKNVRAGYPEYNEKIYEDNQAFINDLPFEQDKGPYTMEQLEFLRANTTLNPIDGFKINKARKDAEKFQQWYNETQHEDIGADYSTADTLEYEIRLNKWERQIAQMWRQHGEDKSLSEFSADVMQQMINEQKIVKR